MRSARFQVYEHQRLAVGESYDSPNGGKETFTEDHFEALAKYYERTETPAFRLGHRCIHLRNQVGFLRVGPVSLEVYPKLGAFRPDADWRRLLLHMLRVVTGVRLAPQDQAPLRARAGDLFDLLVNRFLEVTSNLLHEGLARSYREVEENGTAFRGRLMVGAHLRANHVRQERLYVSYEVHDVDNLPNRILWQALERVRRTTTSMEMLHRVEGIVVDFPDVSGTPIRASDWDQLRLDRRTVRYREALDLARMILRDERPDLRWGDREVIALLFDMNALFEAYLEQALRGVPGVHVKAQVRKRFWEPSSGGARTLRPDLLVFDGEADRPIIVDAKWKVPTKGRPGDDDLRQIFAYLHAFDACLGVLVYPRTVEAHTAAAGPFLGGTLHGRVAFIDLLHKSAPDLASLRAALPAALGVTTGSDWGASPRPSEQPSLSRDRRGPWIRHGNESALAPIPHPRKA